MEEYRRPFREPGESRRPTLSWPRELPIEGEPADVVEIAQSYADWLSQQEQAGRVRLPADAAETGRTITATLKGLKLIGAGAEVYEQQVAQVAALIGAGLEVR